MQNNLIKMSFLPQKWPKRFAYTLPYLDGNVKQKLEAPPSMELPLTETNPKHHQLF